MTESTQQPDMSKSAQEVDTFAAQLADLKAALDRFPFLNEAAPAATYEVWEWWRQVTMPAFIVQLVAAADRAKELEAVRERAARLVEHADFRLGGVLSADSKAADIPSNATSLVKARHLASLRDALAAIDRAQGEAR